MSRPASRSAAGAALSLLAGLAQAHPGHGSRVLDGHVHLEHLAAWLSAWLAPFAGEAAVLTLAIGAIVLWRGYRRARRSSR